MITETRIFVQALTVKAEIGIHADEHGRRQPLIVDVELTLSPGPIETIADTVNYEVVRTRARELADSGHFKLVETFAEQLGLALLQEDRVLLARVRVEKPEALAPDAQAAGVELLLARQ